MAEENQPPHREATYEELVALPPHLVGEILGGKLFASPWPASPHSAASLALAAELGGPFQRGRGGPGGWWFFTEPELHFGRDVLVPDLAGWRRSRMPVRSDVPHFTLAPDWVCEVLSPSTARIDRTLKKQIYAREGLEFLWLVDPALRLLEVLRLHGGQWLERGSWSGGSHVRVEPFEALELELESV
ncbi:Uma2 family endonuclease [Vitiosangium sp. GDMCC 1.1324]|uniref:Uma2 family endonuclease n=1 Tax=Vitiosangium sp. (strain GDMCC 1.1324) TaxID=2138576 RepID=UPI001E369192|nr:Uma2 family endonuclease [Vitiosangium sp. GDMCC 1.1324]